MEEDESLISERAALLRDGPAFDFTSVRNSVLAGYVAGTAGILVGHPLDSIKVLIQMNGAGAGAGANANYSTSAESASKIPCSQCRSLSTAAAATSKAVVPKRSLLSLYAGVQGPLMTVGLVQATNFAIYDSCRRWLHQRRHLNASRDDYLNNFSLADVALSSAAAGGVIAALTSPLQAIKTNQQIKPQSFRKALSQLYRHGGSSFFSGFAPHLFCDSFGRMIYLSCYEILKRRVVQSKSLSGEEDTEMASGMTSADLSLQERMICAGLSGMFCWTIIYPADVVRSRMYAHALSQQRPGPFEMVKSIYRNEGGLKPFYRGLGVTVVRAAPVAAAVLPVYDFAHSWLTTSLS